MTKPKPTKPKATPKPKPTKAPPVKDQVDPTREELLRLVLAEFEAMGATTAQMARERRRLLTDSTHYEEWINSIESWLPAWRLALRRLRESDVRAGRSASA